jgi:hypothetical protein
MSASQAMPAPIRTKPDPPLPEAQGPKAIWTLVSVPHSSMKIRLVRPLDHIWLEGQVCESLQCPVLICQAPQFRFITCGHCHSKRKLANQILGIMLSSR